LAIYEQPNTVKHSNTALGNYCILEEHIVGKARLNFSWRFVEVCSSVIWFGAGLAVQLFHELSDKAFLPRKLYWLGRQVTGNEEMKLSVICFGSCILSYTHWSIWLVL